MLFSILGPSIRPVVMTQSDERYSNNSFCVGVVTDTGHTTFVQTKNFMIISVVMVILVLDPFCHIV